MSGVLLDTCALIRAAEGAQFSEEARGLLRTESLHISAITAWEIGNLARKNRIVLTMPVVSWVRRAVVNFRAELCDLPIEILAGSCELPAAPPNDPADRIIIATARELALSILTVDQKILDYAASGHVRARTF